ncbi:MAG: hypothetical protein PHV11_07225 [Candidatus Bipolaricaulis sp.]|nr:hypothetical protein [Candidatus Bipolaricaulis sp.]
MGRRTRGALVAVLLVMPLCAVAQEATLSVCDYEPPESRISDLTVQGTFNWYDDPYADDRNNAMSASFAADYEGLYSSLAFARALNAHTEVHGAADGWTLALSGAGSLRAFLSGDVFGVGVINLDASAPGSLGIDLTGGVGTGRFRDVTPLARAIRIQNDLLDLGELLAPLTDGVLLDVAQILGEDGPTDSEKLVGVAERLVASGLVLGNEIGIHGLLAIEEVLQSGDETRLCGSDVQARLGASAILYPEFSLAATGILLVRFAAVPDPVSQLDSSAEAKFRLARPEEMTLAAGLSYARRLPDGWTARASVRLTIDRMWTKPDSAFVSYAASGNLTTKLFGSVGLSLVAGAQYTTGDEEMSLSLALNLEADLF